MQRIKAWVGRPRRGRARCIERRDRFLQHAEGVAPARHHVGMRCGIGQRRPEDQAVLQGMAQRVVEIGATHGVEIGKGVGLPRPRIQVVGEGDEGAAHHLGQQVIAAGIVLVGRLVRHAEPARDLAQAERLDAITLDDRQGFVDAGLAKLARRFGFTGHKVPGCRGLRADYAPRVQSKSSGAGEAHQPVPLRTGEPTPRRGGGVRLMRHDWSSPCRT